MKSSKILSCVLACAMVAAMGVSGFAGTYPEGNQQAEVNSPNYETVDVPIVRGMDPALSEAYVITKDGSRVEIIPEIKLQQIVKKNGIPIDEEQYILTGIATVPKSLARGSDSGSDSADGLDAKIEAAIYYTRNPDGFWQNEAFILDGADATFSCGSNIVMSKYVKLDCGQTFERYLGYNENSFYRHGLNFYGPKARGTFRSTVEGPGAYDELSLFLSGPIL